jgi:hypothetical protein
VSIRFLLRRVDQLEATIDRVQTQREDAAARAFSRGRATPRDLRTMYATDGVAEALEDLLRQAFEPLEVAALPAAASDEFARLTPIHPFNGVRSLWARPPSCRSGPQPAGVSQTVRRAGHAIRATTSANGPTGRRPTWSR